MYRKQLLNNLIDHFEVASPDIDESPRLNESPAQCAARLARQKAEALSADFPNHWIIGSDQIAACGSSWLDKPGDYPTAYRQLSEMSEKCATFWTSVCLLGPGAEKSRTETDICRVYFRKLKPDLIVRYLRRAQPFDCAASFKSEGSGIALVERIEGDDPSALIGLPLILLTRMMEDFGLDVL